MVVDASVIGHFGACIDGEYCCDTVCFGECFAYTCSDGPCCSCDDKRFHSLPQLLAVVFSLCS